MNPARFIQPFVAIVNPVLRVWALQKIILLAAALDLDPADLVRGLRP
jgi:hypothetical protein